MEGLGQKGGCTAIHDDLWVRALFLEQGDKEILILSFDLLFFERAVVDRFKGALSRAFGLAARDVFLNTTHTHAGPRISRWAYGGAPDAVYLDQIEEAMMEAAKDAQSRQRTAFLHAGVTRTRLPVSRRKLDENGLARWSPSRSGIICDALPFCLFRDSEGAVISALFSVACHPSMIYETSISAEFPGVATRKLNEYFATEGCMFLQGAAGDTKPRHVAVDEERWREGTWEEMEAAGTEVAEAVIAAAQDELRPIAADLRTHLIDVPYLLEAAPSREELEKVFSSETEHPGRKAWAQEMLTRLDRGLPLCVEPFVSAHLLQLGRGLRLIGIEGEVLARLGLRMLEIYSQGVTFVLGYTNGARIYMPVTEELPESGYEVESAWEYHHPSRPAAGCEKPLLDTLRIVRDSGEIPNE